MASPAAITTLTPGDGEALETFLRSRLASSMFLLSNLRRGGLEDRGEPYQGTYAAAWEDGRIVAAAAHCWNGTVLLQAPGGFEVAAYAAAASGRPVRGLLGPGEQVAAALERFALPGDAAQVDEVGPLYRLSLEELALPAALTRGEVAARRMRPADRELVAAWLAEYAAEALGEAETPERRAQRRGQAERLLAEECAWILEREGRAVALGAFNARIAEAVQVGPVWTPPEERSRGHARAVVAASLQDARAAGAAEAFLFTANGNRAAQRAYEALGFTRVGSYRILLLREPVILPTGIGEP